MNYEEAKSAVYGALWEKDLNTLKGLIDEFPNLLDERYHGDKNILHLAASDCGSDILGYLLSKGLDVDINTLWGEEKGKLQTPLFEAADEGNLENTKLLVSQGANINANLGSYTTPLYEAAGSGHLEVVKFLVEQGADPLGTYPNENWKGGFLNTIRWAYQYPEIQDYLRSVSGYEEPKEEVDDSKIEECKVSSKIFSKKKDLIKDFEVLDYKNYLKKTCRYSLDILTKASIASTGSSKLGGNPDLTEGTEWPHHDDGPYRFLGQINFSEFKGPDKMLPKKGLLALFVADDPDQSFFWQDPGYIKAIFIDNPKDLVSIESPESIKNPSETSVEFSLTVDVPYDEYQAKGWDYEEDYYDTCSDFRNALHKSPYYLLGYPSHCTLAYDPTPGPEWISLLTLSSSDELEWCWHDGDSLMIFIEKEKLLNRDFSNLKSDAG